MAFVTTILDSDLMSDSRVTINANFASLNSAKIEAAGFTQMGRLARVTGSGSLGQTTALIEANNGNVGINVANPQYQLHIVDNNTGGAIVLERTAATLAKWSMTIVPSGSLTLNDVNTGAQPIIVRVTNDFVGINNIIPVFPLDVGGDVNITGVYRVNGAPFVSGSPQTPWATDIDAASHKLTNASAIGIGTPNPANMLHILYPNVTGVDGGYALNIDRTYDAIGDWTGIKFGGGAPNGSGAIRSLVTAGAQIALTFHAQGTQLDGASTAAEIMRIRGDGMVGIGTTAPRSQLSIVPPTATPPSSTANQITVCDWTNNSAYGLRIGYYNDSGNLGSILQSTAVSAGAPLLLNPSGGNVGIGTTSPVKMLHVNGPIHASGFSPTSVTSPNSVTLDYWSGQQAARLISFGPDAVSYGGFMFISTRSDNTNVQYPLVITPAFQVGIQTTTPNYPLSLGAQLGDRLAIYDSGAGINNIFGFGIQGSFFQMYCPAGCRIGLGHGNSATFYEHLSVLSSGNIGIGTASPRGQLSLVGPNVNSVATANQITVCEGSNNPLYHFAMGYYNDGSAVAQGWKSSIQSWAAAGGAPLILNGNGGQVGINTVTPAAGFLLDMVSLDNTDSAGALHIWAQNQSQGAQYSFGGITSSYYYKIQSGAGFYLALNPGGGNVGIGKSNPGVTLDVAGVINASSYIQSQTAFYGSNAMTATPGCIHTAERGVTACDANQPVQSISFDVAAGSLFFHIKNSAGTAYHASIAVVLG